MKKKISILLAAIMIAGTFPQISYGFVNPLKNMDSNAGNYIDNSQINNVMSEIQNINNSQNAQSMNRPPQQVPTTQEGGIEESNIEVPQRRNDYLRESSRKVFGTGVGNWTKKPYFYDAPNLDSIIEKYHLSNFAGCMQECEAYVQSHPYDTLGYYYLAMSYAKCGKKEDAILAYERVITLNDNPMIVKYATNGRNCVIGNEDQAKCFQNVNEPEYLYPYRDMAQEVGLTPVNPQDLINRNLTELQQKFIQNNPVDDAGKDGENKVPLPFQDQDDNLDRFINAPYGNGLSPELEREYKQLQLKNLQDQINRDDDNTPGKYFRNIRDIKEFDSKKKSEGEETIKLALADRMDVEDILKSPEYIQNKKELDEIKMMFGDYGTDDLSSDVTTLLPQLAKDGQNLSPEVVQMMMMQSVMPNIIDTNSSGF